MSTSTLLLMGTPGTWLRFGPLHYRGDLYEMRSDGTLRLEGLNPGRYGIVQFKRNSWGEWDSSWGAARSVVRLFPGREEMLTLPEGREYDPAEDLVAGRVYLTQDEPAIGLAIRVVNFEKPQINAVPAALTDETGYWEARVGESGFGGDLWVNDLTYGTIPLLGYPYSDVVLGTELWGGIVYRYGIQGVEGLLQTGPVQTTEYPWQNQNFTDGETLPGQYRAAK